MLRWWDRWLKGIDTCVRLNSLIKDEDDPILLEMQRPRGEHFDFQKSVSKALLAIPVGETRSYGEIARQLGRPTASRAVGAANGKNPIAIIAPCHRVIGSTGKLTGFAGSLWAKEHLPSKAGRRARDGTRITAISVE